MVFHSALILFTPLMGKFHGTGNPTKFCGIYFFNLAFYPFLLISANYLSVFNINLNTKLILFI